MRLLPSRLKDELARLADAIIEGSDIRADEMLAKHADWVDQFKPHYASITRENVDDILKKKSERYLPGFWRMPVSTGVPPEGREAFGRFLATVGFQKMKKYKYL